MILLMERVRLVNVCFMFVIMGSEPTCRSLHALLQVFSYNTQLELSSANFELINILTLWIGIVHTLYW